MEGGGGYIIVTMVTIVDLATIFFLARAMISGDKTDKQKYSTQQACSHYLGGTNYNENLLFYIYNIAEDEAETANILEALNLHLNITIFYWLYSVNQVVSMQLFSCPLTDCHGIRRHPAKPMKNILKNLP